MCASSDGPRLRATVGLLAVLLAITGAALAQENAVKAVQSGNLPSIRWEALRAGIQDARLLLQLKNVASQDTCPADLKADIQKLLNRVKDMADDKDSVSWKAVAEVARRARQLHTQCSQIHSGNM